MIPLVIDSDIGTWADDVLALGLALQSPEIELRAFTTVEGDAKTRARIARRFLEIAGRTDVVVAAGCDRPLMRRVPGRWAGHEGEGLLDPSETPLPFDPRHSAQVLVEAAIREPGALTLLAIGPLTNVALATILEPRFSAAIKQAVIMGGALRNGPGWLETPAAEWNFACDPEAADVVLRSGMAITLVPYDVGDRVRFRRPHLDRLRASGGALQLAIAGEVERSMARHGSDESWPFDPLALAYLIDRTLLTLAPLHVEVLTGGSGLAGMTVVEAPNPDRPANATVAIDVDAPRFETFLVGRLCG